MSYGFKNDVQEIPFPNEVTLQGVLQQKLKEYKSRLENAKDEELVDTQCKIGVLEYVIEHKGVFSLEEILSLKENLRETIVGVGFNQKFDNAIRVVYGYCVGDISGSGGTYYLSGKYGDGEN